MSIYQVYPNKKKSFFESVSVTTWLIGVNTLFFIISLISLSLGLSWDFIALKPANIFLGKFLWTFLTSMFMHAGFFHLFVNMISLFFVGAFLEKLIGKKRYLYFYLISGLFSGLVFVLASLVFPLDFNTYAVGASGAIFGLIGVLMFLTPDLKVYPMFLPIPIKMKYAAPGMLIILWLISLEGNLPIGNTAHLGGLIAGIVYGIYLRKKYPNKVHYLSRRFN